jgi:protein-L-isoaspartate(D-aspartate) O-methyltransferase
MKLSPLSFTPEFRRMLAELPQPERIDWLAGLAANRDPAREEELREVARACRLDLVKQVNERLGPFDPLHLRALLEVPRERFVRQADIARSMEDTPLPLDDDGLATISAPHAYLLSFRLLELSPGDRVVELGAGSGYGAALAQLIVGDAGRVTTIEIDPKLAAWAAENLVGTKVDVRFGDAVTALASGDRASKIVVTFAVDALPTAWLDAVPEGGRLVAPVGPREKDQRLLCIRRVLGELRTSDHGAVRYVQNRSRRGR